jgi:hypothetical protein
MKKYQRKSTVERQLSRAVANLALAGYELSWVQDIAKCAFEGAQMAITLDKKLRK